MTEEFIDKHGKCNIVNLGVGLETSYYRIDGKNALFFEVDLPEVIELREKYRIKLSQILVILLKMI